MSRSKKFKIGFTLVELLVVIAIIGILVAILLPAVQAAREAARRMACSNNVHQVALSIHNYHDANRALPPGNYQNRRSWMLAIMPFVEEAALFGAYDVSKDAYDPINLKNVTTKRLASFTCPSEDPQVITMPPSYGSYKFTKHSYVANYGNTGFINSAPPPQTYNGVTFRGAPFGETAVAANSRLIRFKHITDGLSKTFLVGEAIQTREKTSSDDTDCRGLTWIGGGCTSFMTLLSPNSTEPDVVTVAAQVPCPGAIPPNPPCTNEILGTRHVTSAARSWHPGGVHVAMCDGSTHFVADEVNIDTWRALSTTTGGEIIQDSF